MSSLSASVLSLLTLPFAVSVLYLIRFSRRSFWTLRLLTRHVPFSILHAFDFKSVVLQYTDRFIFFPLFGRISWKMTCRELDVWWSMEKLHLFFLGRLRVRSPFHSYLEIFNFLFLFLGNRGIRKWKDNIRISVRLPFAAFSVWICNLMAGKFLQMFLGPINVRASRKDVQLKVKEEYNSYRVWISVTICISKSHIFFPLVAELLLLHALICTLMKLFNHYGYAIPRTLRN